MIECHIGRCENHICHTDVNEGPFCNLNKCQKTTEEITAMLKEQRNIPVYNFIPEEEKIAMKEFLTMCAVIFTFIFAVIIFSWGLA